VVIVYLLIAASATSAIYLNEVGVAPESNPIDICTGNDLIALFPLFVGSYQRIYNSVLDEAYRTGIGGASATE
jgi:hypothetical protein